MRRTMYRMAVAVHWQLRATAASDSPVPTRAAIFGHSECAILPLARGLPIICSFLHQNENVATPAQFLFLCARPVIILWSLAFYLIRALGRASKRQISFLFLSFLI